MERIFIALPVSTELQEEISRWVKKIQIPNPEYQTDPGLQASNRTIRWIQPKNLHITLVPPWYEEDVKAVSDKLGAVRGRPFDLNFDRVSFGPTPKKPRLIWAEGQTSREILDLRFKIYEALGRKSEGRPFKLHLTLARFRPADFAAFPLKVLNEKVPWRERFGSFVLMRSRLSPQGADYEAVEEFKLG